MAFTPLNDRAGADFRSTFAHPGTEGFQPDHPAATAAAPPPPAPAPGPDLEARLEAARAEGAALARADLEEELASVHACNALLSAAVEDLETLRPAAIRQAARDVADLVLTLTSRILDRSLALNPDALPALLEGALARFPDRDRLRIRVPADAVEALRERVEPAVAEALVPDSTLADGVVVEGEHGSVESTLSAALEAVEEAVRTWAEAVSC